MKKLLTPVIALCMFAACENKTAQKKGDAITSKDTVVTTNTKPTFTGCYMMVIEKDTAWMHLDDSATYLTGHLNYNRFQKDKNRGSVTLKVVNDKLKGWYTFNSEGKLSMREIVFKIDGMSLAEAYGDVEMKRDSVFFKYPVTLNFEIKHPFKKIACK